MKRTISIIMAFLIAAVIFPLISFAEETTVDETVVNMEEVSDKAKITVPVAKAGFWESADPIFTIGFNTIKLNGTITVEEGALNNIITIVSNPNDKKDGVTAGMFARHWTLPENASIQIYDANDVVVADNRYLTTGMKIAVTDAQGKQLSPYTIVVTGNVSGANKFTLSDYVSILNHLIKYKSLTPLQAAAADLNQNGRVDIGDLAMMAGIML